MTIQVRRLPKDPGPAGWNELLPQPEPAQKLEDKLTADWLVIGAGFAGLAAARRLSMTQKGDRIIVLDAVRVGQGPAGRNSGFMIDLPHDLASENYGGALEKDREEIRANRAAIDFALETAAEFGLPAEAITRAGKINAAATDRGMKHNEDFARHLSGLGEEHEHFDAEQMQAITGSQHYRGGLFTPKAVMIQPAMYVRGVAEGLQTNLVSIFENSPVISLKRDGSSWVARTPDGQVSAPKVILAVNGHAESFGFFRRRLMHVFTYASMTRALTSEEATALGGKPEWGVTPSDPMGTTVRRICGTGGDRIVIRNRFTYDPSMEVTDRRIHNVAQDHDRSFEARFPVLAGVEMEYRWGGRLCLSRNGVSAFGPVEDGIYSACCQNGLGTAKGTFSGIAAADLACGNDTEFSRFAADADDPVLLPSEPLSWIGANAAIRWSEWKAGAEL